MTDPIDKQFAEFNRLVAKRKSMKLHGPQNSAATAAPSKAALQARADLAAANRDLAATKAKLATAQANLAEHAKVATVPPATKPALSPRDQRRAAAKGTLADASDSHLLHVAGHRSATDADRSAARAELEKRGWTVHPNGSFSQSIRKQARR